MRRYGFRKILIVFFCLLSVFLSGCESLRYYAHITAGQLKLVTAREPIEKLIASPASDPLLRKRLAKVLEIRAFAEDDLLLPADSHYLTYADLKRPYAVWNVLAAPEFSLAPKTWYYPVIGRAAYRGFFSEEKALACAAKLAEEGWDVYVGGVTAYSTLGWFADPVLNTFISRDEDAVAALIFHELAHQVVYVSDDTTFNESFATAVEQAGLKRWTTRTDNPLGYKAYLLRRDRQQSFVALIAKHRQMLSDLYASDLGADEMRRRKVERFTALKREYGDLKAEWNGYTGYDAWFASSLNNAKLNSVGAYYDLVPAFTHLLDNLNGDLASFYENCRQLANLPKAERDRRLAALRGSSADFQAAGSNPGGPTSMNTVKTDGLKSRP